jgi:hypothetical protein
VNPWLGSAAVAGLLLAACGSGGDGTTTASYGRAGGDGSTTSSPDTTSTTVAAVGLPAEGAGVDRAPTGGTAPPPVNRTVREDPSGLRLTFVVADKLTFGPTEGIVMELTVASSSGERRYLSGDQPGRFAIAVEGAASAAWSEEACRTQPFEPAPGPVVVDPGEDVRFVVHYPLDPSCRIDPGTYLAAGRVELCPTDTLIVTSNGQPRCDETRTELVVSTPLQIEITP